MFASTPYTLEQAATDILRGVAERRLYVLAPGKLRALWLVKRLFPAGFLRLFRRLRDRRLARLRRDLPPAQHASPSAPGR